MATKDVQNQQENDEKPAQQLGQAEQGHAGAPVPVVVGIPVGQSGVPAPVMGQPVGAMPYGGMGGMPYGDITVVTSSLPIEEILVLRYRFSMMCFATIDIFSTALDAVTNIVRAIRISEEGHHGHADHMENELLLGALGLVFLIGPICGLVGARKLRRRLVAIYLAFCVIKTLHQTLMAMMTPLVWFFIVLFVQLWITKIVSTFWSSLRAIPDDRLQQLLDPQTLHGSEIGFAYW